jgi:hypothetical protein
VLRRTDKRRDRTLRGTTRLSARYAVVPCVTVGIKSAILAVATGFPITDKKSGGKRQEELCKTFVHATWRGRVEFRESKPCEKQSRRAEAAAMRPRGAAARLVSSKPQVPGCAGGRWVPAWQFQVLHCRVT